MNERNQLIKPAISHRRRRAETFASLLVFATAPLCHAQSGSTTLNEARGMASYLWQTITTTCGIKGAASTSVFLRPNRELYEYREVRTSLYPWSLSKADELNGTQFKGLAVLRAPARRSISPKRSWSQWIPEQAETRNMTAEWFATQGPYETHDQYKTWWPDLWVVLIEKQHGEWSFTFPQLVGVNRTWNHPLNREALAQAAGPKSSCETLTSNDPFGLHGQ